MNLAHIHLLSNHIPILGVFFGILIFLQGTLSRNQSVKSAAYFIFIVSAIGAVIAYTTGEPAEDLVEKISGISKSMIEAHEEAATLAYIAIGLLGVLSLSGIILSMVRPKLNSKISLLVGILAILSLGLMARTGYLGGKIRHSEFNPTTAMPSTPEMPSSLSHD